MTLEEMKQQMLDECPNPHWVVAIHTASMVRAKLEAKVEELAKERDELKKLVGRIVSEVNSWTPSMSDDPCYFAERILRLVEEQETAE